MKKVNKISHPSTKKKSIDKNETEYVTMLEMRSLQEFPGTGQYAERKAFEMIKWAEESDDALSLEQFYQLIKIRRSDFDRLMKKFPVVANAHEYAKMVLGNRREKIVNHDIGSIKHMMPYYSPSWAEREKTIADLKNEDSKSNATLNVSMMNYGTDVEIKGSAETTDGE